MTFLHALLRDPVAAPLRRPSPLDAGLAALGTLALAAETVAVGAWPARAGEVALAAVLVLAVAFRRTHPFGAFAVAFSAIIAAQWLQYALAAPTQGLSSGAFVLLLPYALGRFARGRQVLVGLGMLLAAFAGSLATGDFATPGDAVGALVVMHFPLVAGLGMRALDGRHVRDVANAQLMERQLLARELHDTVAHRVTAITLQAQAARTVLDRQPQAARTALEAIESESVLALAELRSLLGTLRSEDAPLRPVAGRDALEELVAAAGPQVHLQRLGPAVSLAPALEHALNRIVRESLHNAARHARAVTRVEVTVDTRGAAVQLTVTNDGEPARPPGPGGLGLVGMRERANLVGGRLEAGPQAQGGWKVWAELPRGPAQEGRRI